MKVVLNSEPLDYSLNAKTLWHKLGYVYHEEIWENISYKKHHGVEILIVRLAKYIDEDILSLFPDLKYVISATTGQDHVDIQGLTKNNVELVSLRGSDKFLTSIPSTAEHTWALLLSLTRKIPSSYIDVKNGGWNRDLFRGIQLAGKTLGIIGLGRTGIKVANYADAFGMEVQYFDPLVEKSKYKKFLEIRELVATSDIITVHVHLNESTQRMVSEELLADFKIGSYLINTSRGGVVDEVGIINSLRSGQLNGYATDVIANELMDLGSSPIIDAMQAGLNIIVTPHIGGATVEAMHSCEEFIVKKFKENCLK